MGEYIAEYYKGYKGGYSEFRLQLIPQQYSRNVKGSMLTLGYLPVIFPKRSRSSWIPTR